MLTGVEEDVQLLGRVPSPLLDQAPHVEHMTVDDVVRSLEDALSQKQWSRAVQLLRAVRSLTEPQASHGEAAFTSFSLQEAEPKCGNVWQYGR